uniref:Kinesin-like protein n=1 Tax=Anisakis simplex TaxID=6269 RepID=A0A0M3J970_ANISI
LFLTINIHVSLFRIRPQIVREKLELCRVCTAVTPGEPQVSDTFRYLAILFFKITIGDDRSFTYDCVFDQDTHQQLVYDRCVRSLIEGTLEGFNATVLAYGQTGSGKTYTMGTAFDMTTASDDDSVGIVPRAMEHLFTLIEQRKREARERGFIEPIFDVAVQFIEVVFCLH